MSYSDKKTECIISVASWEDRFIEGFKIIIREKAPEMVLLFYFEEYLKWSKNNIEKADLECNNRGVEIKKVKLYNSDLIQSYRILEDELKPTKDKIILDITTMPRETIWIILKMLQKKYNTIKCIYHKPERYGEWLSRDPAQPRLVYGLSGIASLKKNTALLIITGFDVERAKQLNRYYEPKRLLMGLQEGKQYRNFEENRKKHEVRFKGIQNIKWFDIDSYSLKKVESTLKGIIKEEIKDNNIIASSLGPKISALGLYRMRLLNPEIALTYAPAHEYNRDYSFGYKETIIEELSLA